MSHYSIGICPKGDDPLTPFTDFRTIMITVSQYFVRPTSGGYVFSFFDQSVVLPISQPTDYECQKIIESLPNVDIVKCGVTRNGRYGGYQMLVQLMEFPTNPQENNMLYHTGNPPISAFSCDTYNVQSAGTMTCEIEDVTNDAAKLPGKYISLSLSYSH